MADGIDLIECSVRGNCFCCNLNSLLSKVMLRFEYCLSGLTRDVSACRETLCPKNGGKGLVACCRVYLYSLHSGILRSLEDRAKKEGLPKNFTP